MSELVTHTRTYQLSAVLGIAAVLAAGAAAKVQPAYDELWSVQIVAQGDSCGSEAATYPVRMVGGVVQYAGNLSLAVSGRVNQRGVVRVRIAVGTDRANATGRLSGSNGSGRWVSPTRGCSGYWTAARQG